MKFQREVATTEFCAEILPLLERHYHEIAHYQDIVLDPDFKKYIEIEEAGFLRVFTARDDAGKLAGYGIFVVRANMHYRQSLQAVQDVLFIAPEHRNAGFGAKLISFCDGELQKEGVQVVYHHVKLAHDFGPLMEKIGYEKIETIYGRRLSWQ
jgi:GNAT superfamily N-acetyltransferase